MCPCAADARGMHVHRAPTRCTCPIPRPPQVSSVEHTPCGVLFRGSPRRESTAEVSALVQSRLAAAPLSDTPPPLPLPQLLLISDPLPLGPPSADKWNDEWSDAALDEIEPDPVFLALPAELQPAAATNSSLSVVASIASQLVTAAVAVGWAATCYVGTPAVRPSMREEYMHMHTHMHVYM